jgi:hypothetical protein
MISPAELREYLAVMREGGCQLFKQGETIIHLGPPKMEPMSPQHQKDDYRDLLFAATEGMPDPDEVQQ